MLFKRFLLLSVLVHAVAIVFDPSHFFFRRDTPLNEGSIDVDLIAFDAAPKHEESEAPPLMLPQVPKKFELEQPKKPDELSIDEKKEPPKEEPKVLIEQKKTDEDLTKVSLDRLIKEVNREKEKKAKAPVLTQALKERKQELEKGLLLGNLSMGGNEAGYRGVVGALIRRNYVLPEVYELKNSHIQAVVELLISDDGGITKLTLRSSSQNALFDQLALKTVENSAPFPAPPRDQAGKVITITFDSSVAGQ